MEQLKLWLNEIQKELELLFERIPKDKYQHFIIFGFVPFWLVYMVVSQFWLPVAALAGLSAAIISSAGKEYLDKQQGKTPDFYDAMAGILCGFLMWWMV